MQRTTVCNRGDVVLVNFVFSDEEGAKRRPALILSSDTYNRGRKEAIIAAITSNVTRKLPGDHIISDWQNSGLLWPSTVTGILRTIHQKMIQRRLGSMPQSDMQRYEETLRTSLELR